MVTALSGKGNNRKERSHEDPCSSYRRHSGDLPRVC